MTQKTYKPKRRPQFQRQPRPQTEITPGRYLLNRVRQYASTAQATGPFTNYCTSCKRFYRPEGVAGNDVGHGIAVVCVSCHVAGEEARL